MVVLKHTWRKVVENVHCPSPQPKDYAHIEEPGFREDPDIFIEFDDGVFYQASLDGSEVAIMADYPGLLPFAIVSIRKASSKKEPPACFSPVTLNCVFIGSALNEPHSIEGGLQEGSIYAG